MKFPRFSDVANKTLRTYNRTNIMYNLKQALGKGAAYNYAAQFKRDEQIDIIKMHNRFVTEGYENVRRELIRGMQ